jgi:CubicO group peptidase (beta-lactamase class C family)
MKLFHLLPLLIPVQSALCPPDGPLLPRPSTLAKSPLISAATKSLTQTIDKAMAGQITIPWDVTNISFSIVVVAQDTKIFEYHYLAKGNVRGVKRIDGDSQYLIGSISKVITDLLALKTGVSLQDPITKYIPELSDPSTPIRWDQVTVESLGNHLSGMPQTCEFYVSTPASD